LHGTLVDMRHLMQIAADRQIKVVEDACQCPGALVQGKPAGAWGDMAVLSFGGSKLLTAGRGGAILSRDPEAMHRIKIFSDRGNDAFPLSQLQSAVLIPQGARLDEANARRLAAVQQLLKACGDLPGLSALQLPSDPASAPAFYKLPWLLSDADNNCDSPQFEQRRRQFLAAIQAEGIAMDTGFRGFARRTQNRCSVVGDLPHARRAAAGTVVLHHPVLLEPPSVIEQLAAAIRKVAEHVLGGR
jgi:dTDP-4-amino-4,6-dideoxygalactose transaminase